MLPGAAYTDPAVYAWEIEHLFRRGCPVRRSRPPDTVAHN
jgi:hypothetical protein